MSGIVNHFFKTVQRKSQQTPGGQSQTQRGRNEGDHCVQDKGKEVMGQGLIEGI